MLKVLYSLLLFLGFSVSMGCQLQQEDTMVLLDEKVKEIKVSKSNGIGDMNQNVIQSFTDKQSIKTFDKAIRTAMKQTSDIETTKPDFDVMVEYEEGFPTHAIHLWLGEENEKSTLMYMVDGEETYITSSKMTNQLRDLIGLDH